MDALNEILIQLTHNNINCYDKIHSDYEKKLIILLY